MATLRYWLPHASTQYICLVATLTSLLLVTNTACKDLPGHQLPFGESGKNVPVDRVQGFPATEDFLHNYASQRKPLLMSGAITRSRAVQRWTDEYLIDLVDRSPQSVLVNPPDMDDHYMSFRRFLNEYNTTDLYLVDDVPAPLKSDVPLPCPLQCPSWANHLKENGLFFSSGGTKGVAHIDVYDSFLCSVRGVKQIKLVDPSYGLENFHIRDGAVPVDINSVDLNEFPIFSKVEFLIAKLTPGDCIYIPEKWIHQVNSYGSNIGINYFWFRYTTEEILDSGACHAHQSCDPEFYVSNITKYSLVQRDDLDFCYPANFLKYECSVSDSKHMPAHN